VTNGSSSTSTPTSSTVKVNGDVTAGYLHELNITIPDKKNAGGFYTDASALIVNPDGAPHAPFMATYTPTFNPATAITNYGFTQPGETQALINGTYSGNVGAMAFTPLFAAGGSVILNAGTLLGNGHITAYGGPTISVTNSSPDYLLLSDIVIPDEPGGE